MQRGWGYDASLQFDDNWCVDRSAGLIADRSVHQHRAPEKVRAIPAVEVAKYVQARTDIEHPTPEHITSGPVTRANAVEVAERRSMSNQNIGSSGNECPMPGDFEAALPIECQAEKPGLHRRSPEPQSCDFTAAIFQVMDIAGHESGSSLAITLE